VVKGEFRSKPKQVQPDEHTIRDLMEFWLAAQLKRGDLSANTVNTCYRICARRLIGKLAEVRLDRVDLRALERYRDESLRAGRASATVDLDFRILRMAWRWGRQIGLCPVQDLPRPTMRLKPTRSRYTPTQSEVELVAEALDGWSRLAFLVLSSTGARIGEIARLRWRDLDLEDGWLRFVGKTSHEQEPREVPFSPALASTLCEWGAGAPDEGIYRTSPSNVRRHLKQRIDRACEAQGVRRFTPQALRRFAVDEMARAGWTSAPPAPSPGTAQR